MLDVATLPQFTCSCTVYSSGYTPGSTCIYSGTNIKGTIIWYVYKVTRGKSVAFSSI